VVLAVAECVLMHGLDVVVLAREAKGKIRFKGLGRRKKRRRRWWWALLASGRAHLTWRCRERRLSGRGAGI